MIHFKEINILLLSPGICVWDHTHADSVGHNVLNISGSQFPQTFNENRVTKSNSISSATRQPGRKA